MTWENIKREALEFYSQFLPETWVIFCLEELTPEQKRTRSMPMKFKVYQIPKVENGDAGKAPMAS